jgi:hypothetical protein
LRSIRKAHATPPKSSSETSTEGDSAGWSRIGKGWPLAWLT